MKLTTLLLTGVAALGFNSHAFAQQALPQANDAYFKTAQEQLAARLALQPINGQGQERHPLRRRWHEHRDGHRSAHL